MADDAEQAPQAKLDYWIPVVAKELRTQSGWSMERLSSLAGVSFSALNRFERMENWPKDISGLLAAYAKVAGLEDAREVVGLALTAWGKYGTAPVMPSELVGHPETTPEDVAASLDAALRERLQSQDDGSAPGAATSQTRPNGRQRRQAKS